MANIERTVENMAVGKDLLVGGSARVSGGARVGGTLRVCGWLEAPNVKGPMKGLFRTPAALKSEYPDPQPGWMALVGTTLPAPLYMEKDGEWTDTGNTAGTLVVGLSDIESRLTALEGELSAAGAAGISGLNAAHGNTAVTLSLLMKDGTGHSCSVVKATNERAGIMSAEDMKALYIAEKRASDADIYIRKAGAAGGPVTLDVNGFIPDALLSDYVSDALSDNTEDIKTLKSDVTGLEGSIRTLEQNQSFDEGELQKLKQRVAALERISG